MRFKTADPLETQQAILERHNGHKMEDHAHGTLLIVYHRIKTACENTAVL